MSLVSLSVKPTSRGSPAAGASFLGGMLMLLIQCLVAGDGRELGSGTASGAEEGGRFAGDEE
jgi:hypothetical protein